jgi:hypothetical protein
MDILEAGSVSLKTPLADPKNLNPVPVEWSKNSEDLISVFLKRGDQSAIGKRHLQPCGYIDPDMFYKQNKYLPVITEFNNSAFTHVQVQRSRLSFIIDAITKNAEYEEQGKSDRVLFDDAILTTAEKSKIITPDYMAPIDLSSKAGAIVKEVKTPTAKSQLIADLNAIAAGSYTYGSGGTYALQGLAYADIAAILTGNLTLKQVSVLSETIGSSLSSDLAGFTFEDDGQGYLDTVEVNAIAYTLNGNSGTPGTIILKNQYLLRGPTTTLTASRYLFNTVATLAHDAFIYNCRFDAASNVNSRNTIFSADTKLKLRMFNNVIARSIAQGIIFPATTQFGLLQIANTVITGCSGGINNNSQTVQYKNVAFINNGATDISNATNATVTNCATNNATLGGTLQNCVLSVVAASAFANVDIADFANGFRSKKGGQLYDTGVESGIAERTANIYGEAIKAPYEIGVGREQEKKRAGGGSLDGSFRGDSFRGGRAAFRGGTFR